MSEFPHNELTEPLGLGPRPPFAWRRAVLWALGGVAAGGLIFVAVTGSLPPSEGYAVAVIERHPAPAELPVAAVTPPPPLAEPRASTASQMESESGVKVVRSGSGQSSGAMIIEVPAALGLRLPPAPDKRLVEKTKFGPLPKIGADGSRPSEVYARPFFVADRLKGAPRIALVVGGLGITADSAEQAITRLPAAVSLAFAPYGAEVERESAQAREAGHETLLQAPMETFDPGESLPHSLGTAASAADNADNLHWLMSRFTGYVGIVNYLGAKFTSDKDALDPVLREIGARGLIYIDDGTSPRSVARHEASALNLANAGADVVIDADPSPRAIETALSRLEALARANGSAVGTASALPASLDHIARWARSLEARGVVLAPISTLASPAPAAQANR